MVLGSHLVSSYRFEKDPAGKSVAEVIDAWPQLQACTIEFGNSPFQIHRAEAVGTEDDILEWLSQACREALNEKAQPVKPLGSAEGKMLNTLLSQTPYLSSTTSENSNGLWRIFHVVRLPDSGLFPQVVGIRDDCDVGPPEGFENSATAEDTSQSDDQWPKSRLVVWGIAVPVKEGEWTTYVGRASLKKSQFGINESLIPDGAKRSMTVSDGRRASIIGFTGSSPDAAKSFYEELSARHGWKLVSQWQHSANNWTAKYTSTADSKLEGIQVQLHVNHNQPMRGLITLTPSKQP